MFCKAKKQHRKNMDEDIVISIKNLTKTYKLYTNHADRVKETFNPFRKKYHHPFNALTDVSFNVKRGEMLGIIGRNGSGKSTLLQIICGILQPTSGSIEINGRVSALLELGAGFNPEFTGRQNVYINGAILGLKHEEIEVRLDDIITFAEIGDFIDQPVKTYSSGMYVRLAFSIAISVDPDVLIIDEALSVGDQGFQQKCVDRMMEFKKVGKTIVFCSHSMYLINELCAKSVWLCDGRTRSYGKTSKVISEYLAYLDERTGKDDAVIDPAPVESSSPPDIIIEDMRLLDDKGRLLEYVKQFQPVVFQIRTRCTGPPLKGHLSIGFERPDGQVVFGTTTKISGLKPVEFVGEQVMELVIPSISLVGGSYRVKAIVGDQHALRPIHELSSAPFQIESDHPEIGMLWIEHHWRFPEAKVTNLRD